ncbi:Protein of unknown function [Cotesia congregata]|uniref:Homeobox domain-containing protein n=1 Tax=Cotesia congregata TaxID=51543 RepID=A0A8J2E764_COTCN|nr:Protein of unknown function [Cotesia congregata]
MELRLSLSDENFKRKKLNYSNMPPIWRPEDSPLFSTRSNSKRQERTVFTNDQLLRLEKEYISQGKYLCRLKRVQVARDLGLNDRQKISKIMNVIRLIYGFRIKYYFVLVYLIESTHLFHSNKDLLTINKSRFNYWKEKTNFLT